MADARTYPVTADKITALTVQLATHGLAVDLTKDGEATQGKWDIAWTRSPQDITIQVKAHPFAQESFFWSKVQDALT